MLSRLSSGQSEGAFGGRRDGQGRPSAREVGRTRELLLQLLEALARPVQVQALPVGVLLELGDELETVRGARLGALVLVGRLAGAGAVLDDAAEVGVEGLEELVGI